MRAGWRVEESTAEPVELLRNSHYNRKFRDCSTIRKNVNFPELCGSETRNRLGERLE
jgi:hypothetical protein